ncbi:MAG: DoxX family protein, partial [Mucilaginibacter sp.]|nr:DoxX family protein [Mucilaginibacter sp.]
MRASRFPTEETVTSQPIICKSGVAMADYIEQLRMSVIRLMAGVITGYKRNCIWCRIQNNSILYFVTNIMLFKLFSPLGKTYHQYAPFILRLVIGFGFMAHGWAKLSRGTAGFEKLLIQTGVPFAHISSYIVPFTELLGGLATFIGVCVSITAIPLIITMITATLTVQIHYGFSSVKTIGLT